MTAKTPRNVRVTPAFTRNVVPTPPALVGPDRFYRAVGLRRKPLASLISSFNETLPL